MIRENDFYRTLKNMTLKELVLILIDRSEDEKEDRKKFNNENHKILYTIDELIEKYPFFTRYNINKAIEKDNLPYFFIGNRRMFNKEEIDKWLDKETKTKNERIKYNI